MLKKLVQFLPSKVRITSKVTYEVVFIDDFLDGKTLGECRHETKQIVIKKGLSATETLKTLIHEITHALALENEFTLTEQTVLHLESAIYRLLRLNGWLTILVKIFTWGKK